MRALPKLASPNLRHPFSCSSTQALPKASLFHIFEFLEDRLHANLGPWRQRACSKWPAAGADSDIVVATGAWSATANASWLHTTCERNRKRPCRQFSIDANTGVSRTGTLTIAGQTLTVTQAPAGYVPAPGITTLQTGTSLSHLLDIGVDAAEDVYVIDNYVPALEEWTPQTQSFTSLPVPTFGTDPFISPTGLGLGQQCEQRFHHQ